MSTKNESHDPIDRDELAQLGYEARDVSIGVVNKLMWWFFIFTAVFILIGLGLYQLMVPGGVGAQQPVVRRKLPPEPNPLLQSNVTAVQDMVDLRARELTGLRSYGWVDRNAGVSQIPIDRAIEIVATQGSLTANPSAPMSSEPNATAAPVGGGGNP
jgi:hypothetical protein